MTRSRMQSLLRAAPLLALALLLAAFATACTGSDGGDDAATATVEADGESTASAASTGAATAAPSAPTARFPRTLTDDGGTAVTISDEPARIASLSPAVTEMLFAIGAGDLVVARDDYSDYPPAALELDAIQMLDPDPEAVLALDPQLVILSGLNQRFAEQLRGLGLTVLVMDPATLEAIYDGIELLGGLTGHASEASTVVAAMRKRAAAITEAIAEVEQGPRVFFELDPGLYTVNTGTFIGVMLETLKAQNIAEGAESPFPQLTAEAVIEADPEVVFLTDAAEFIGEGGEDAESVAARPGWSTVSAVANGRIHALDGDLASRPGPRIVEGLEAMARALYPDRFE